MTIYKKLYDNLSKLYGNNYHDYRNKSDEITDVLENLRRIIDDNPHDEVILEEQFNQSLLFFSNSSDKDKIDYLINGIKSFFKSVEDSSVLSEEEIEDNIDIFEEAKEIKKFLNLNIRSPHTIDGVEVMITQYHASRYLNNPNQGRICTSSCPPRIR